APLGGFSGDRLIRPEPFRWSPGLTLETQARRLCHQPTALDDERLHCCYPVARAYIGEEIGPALAHQLGVPVHHLEAGADIRGEVDLVDHQEIGTGDARPALARDLVAGGDVDDID